MRSALTVVAGSGIALFATLIQPGAVYAESGRGSAGEAERLERQVHELMEQAQRVEVETERQADRMREEAHRAANRLREEAERLERELVVCRRAQVTREREELAEKKEREAAIAELRKLMHRAEELEAAGRREEARELREKAAHLEARLHRRPCPVKPEHLKAYVLPRGAAAWQKLGRSPAGLREVAARLQVRAAGLMFVGGQIDHELVTALSIAAQVLHERADQLQERSKSQARTGQAKELFVRARELRQKAEATEDREASRRLRGEAEKLEARARELTATARRHPRKKLEREELEEENRQLRQKLEVALKTLAKTRTQLQAMQRQLERFQGQHGR